jgi:hypothetical protein
MLTDYRTSFTICQRIFSMTDGLFRGNNIETAPCVIRHEPGAADRGEYSEVAGTIAGAHSP